MSDGRQIFKALKQSLTKLFPKMDGHEASHFGTLLHMITGMIASKHCHLPKLSGKLSNRAKHESPTMKFKRWLSNNKVNGNIFLPFLEKVLPSFVGKEIKLLIDGSIIGRDSACLMASIVYKKRAIPIAWLVIEGRKGHFSQTHHLELLEILKGILPSGIPITLIGDGEFDGVDFLQTIESYGWHFVVRTSKSAKFNQAGIKVALPKKMKEGQTEYWYDVDFTDEYYGPLTLAAWRYPGKQEIFYLLSSHKNIQFIKECYKKRQIIETFFSDLKTKGFHLQKSHISDLRRLGNLTIVACLSYIWVVLLGNYALNQGLNKMFHRTERCDLSLLQLGFRYLEYLINNELRLPDINFGVLT